MLRHLSACLSLLLSGVALAAAPQPPAVDARAWLLMDATSGQSIASRNPKERIEPASLTKLMTAYLAFAALKGRSLALGQTIRVSERAWHASGSRMFIEPRRPVTVEELLHGMIVQSGNDACIALAEAVAGSESAFVERMNRPARRSGRRLVSVVIGATSENLRARESQKLLNFGFQSYDTLRLYQKGDAIGKLQVWKGSKPELKAGAAAELYVTVPKGTADALQAQLVSQQPLIAPLEAGQRVAMLRVSHDGKPLTEYPVVALESVAAAGFFARAWDSVRLWLS